MANHNRKPHCKQARGVNHPSESGLKSLSPDQLEVIWRLWDDPPLRIINGVIAETGCCKIVKAGCRAPILIERRTVVLAIRNASGRIYGLQNINGRWLTKPQAHWVNLKRASWTNEIEVFRGSLTATIEARRRNVATVARNGQSWVTLQAVADQLNVTLVDHSTASRFAPVAIEARAQEMGAVA